MQIAPRAFADGKEAQSATLKKVTLARSIRLGFRPLLSSAIFCYFLLKSDGVLRLENRLPKRHGGSHTPPEDRRARSSGSEAA